MKKAITLFVAVAYMVLTSGIVVDLHYCMGKLAAVDFKHNTGKACERCGMQGKDCCKDEVKVVKLDDSHQQSFANATTELAQVPVLILSQIWQSQTPIAVISHSPHSLSPPDRSSQSALPLLCVFRI